MTTPDVTKGEQPTSLAEDLLDDVEAIRAYLGWPTVRKVYHAKEIGGPIRKRKGLGIYAFKSELDAWMRATETLPGQHSA